MCAEALCEEGLHSGNEHARSDRWLLLERRTLWPGTSRDGWFTPLRGIGDAMDAVATYLRDTENLPYATRRCSTAL